MAAGLSVHPEQVRRLDLVEVQVLFAAVRKVLAGHRVQAEEHIHQVHGVAEGHQGSKVREAALVGLDEVDHEEDRVVDAAVAGAEDHHTEADGEVVPDFQVLMGIWLALAGILLDGLTATWNGQDM